VFARVIINLSLDRTFDYRVPPPMTPRIRVGSKVKVPFGNSMRDGYVLALTKRSCVPDVKDVAELVSERPLILPEMIDLAEWMADYYCCTREQAVQALLPAAVRSGRTARKKQSMVRLAEDVDLPSTLESLAKASRTQAQAAVLKRLGRGHAITRRQLRAETGVSASTIQTLIRKNLISVEEEQMDRDPMAGIEVLPTVPLLLSDEQRSALDMVCASFHKSRKDVVLLFGVTGSGKTEVYLQAIDKCMQAGQDTIVLVPEIALTPQTMEQFRGRFGHQVSLLHSALSDGERFDEWTKINEQRVKIVVGARSAVFAPFRNLGLIIVDEEHESSYKQDHPPRYNARDVAVMRGHMQNATVILGSATPSLESGYNVRRGKYHQAALTHRVDDQAMPAMEIVDMAAIAMAEGRPQVFSQQLVTSIEQVLENGEQVMLFLNRRGYATQLQCHCCGYLASCDNCSVNFTYHRNRNQLLCHLCGEIRRAPERCPDCGDSSIRYTGLGTQKIESMTKGIFSYARVLRMDSDTMTRKNAYREALSAFRAGEYDILIGTQMIAKGLHFPNVTLVGIMFADLTLNLPDFRAGERTFQLLVQVAGRAGRGEVPGRVIVQTYTPYHPVLLTAAKQEYPQFFEDEIESRRQLGLPPVSHLLLIVLKGEDESLVITSADDFAAHLQPCLPDDARVTPPMPSPVQKKRGLHHFQLLLTTRRIQTLSRVVKQSISRFRCPKGVQISVDVDPSFII